MKIVKVPQPVLTTPAKPVINFDKKLQKIVAEMKSTLIATRNPKGVGLAAPQIGISSRIFITRPTEKSPIRVFINPKIISESNKTTDGVPDRENKLEGCLSIPKIWGKIHRNLSLTLAYQDKEGKIHEEKFTGFIATIIQHETDHVNGILFTQRVLEQKGKLYQSEIDDNGKENLNEIVI